MLRALLLALLACAATATSASVVGARESKSLRASNKDRTTIEQQRKPRAGRLRRLILQHGEVAIHLAIIAAAIREPTISIWHDQWHAIRSPPPDASDSGRRVWILRHRRRAAQVGALLGGVGIGLTAVSRAASLGELLPSSSFHKFGTPAMLLTAGLLSKVRVHASRPLPLLLLSFPLLSSFLPQITGSRDRRPTVAAFF